MREGKGGDVSGPESEREVRLGEKRSRTEEKRERCWRKEWEVRGRRGARQRVKVKRVGRERK